MSSKNKIIETPSQDDPIRVLFVTEDDPIYVIQFFDVFFAEYPRNEIDVIGITVVDAFHEPIWKTAMRMLRFYGLVDFIRLSLRFVLLKLKRRSIANLAKSHGIKLMPTGSINNESYVELVREISPSVVVSVAAPEIFRKPILQAPEIKCINIHCGRLPIYRGMMPNFWQLLKGESHATITIHEMAEKLDAGGIIATKEFPLLKSDSLDRIIVGTKQEGARLMMEVLAQFHTFNEQVQSLNMEGASYFSFPSAKDVRSLRKMGHRML